jgi:hypothetical protein
MDQYRRGFPNGTPGARGSSSRVPTGVVTRSRAGTYLSQRRCRRERSASSQGIFLLRHSRTANPIDKRVPAMTWKTKSNSNPIQTQWEINHRLKFGQRPIPLKTETRSRRQLQERLLSPRLVHAPQRLRQWQVTRWTTGKLQDLRRVQCWTLPDPGIYSSSHLLFSQGQIIRYLLDHTHLFENHRVLPRSLIA